MSIYQGNSNNQTLLHVPLGVYKTGWCGEKEYGGIDTATLKWLLKQGLDPNACDVDGYTSLHAVTRINPHDPKKAANILIEFGADPLVLDAANTPLSVHFLKEGNLELAKWFAEKGTTPYDAIIACDLSKVEQVFNPRDSVSPVRGGLTPLHVAALANSSPEIVYRLIKTSSNLDQTDELGKTALVLAIENQLPEMALSLIKAGASVALLVPEGSESPYQNVMVLANPELLALLIEGKTGAELGQLLGPYTKYLGINKNSLDCLNILVERGISPAAVDVSGLLGRYEIADPDIAVTMLELIDRLIKEGASHLLSRWTQQKLVESLNANKGGVGDAARNILVNCLARGMSSRWSNTESLLHNAVKVGDATLVKSILATNESLVYPSEPWRRFARHLAVSPLRMAVEGASCLECISLLLSAGSQVINDEILEEAIAYCRSETILAMLLDYKARSSGISNVHDPVTLLKTAEDAAKRGMTDILESLIEKGLSLNSSNNGKPIFLTLIAEHPSIKNLDWAKKYGADLTLPDSDGRNLLHHLVSGWKFNEDIFKKLLKLGLDVNSKDGKGFTPVHLCVGNKDVREKLLELGGDYGADLTLADASGKTLLHKCAMEWRCDLQYMQVLIDAGISPQIRDDKGNTALAYVSSDLRNETTRKLKLLVEAGLHPDDAGDKKHLNAALVADDIPFAIWLIEQQAQVSKCDLANKKVLSALSKIIRSRPELIVSQLDSLDAEQRGLLEPLLNKAINAPAEADRNELPELLREGGWPIPVPAHTPTVVGKCVLPECEARLVWKADEQKLILSSRRVKHDDDSDRKFEDAIARFEKKPCTIKLGRLINATDELFIKYWNDHSVALAPHVEVASVSDGHFGLLFSRYSKTGLRTEDLRYLLARYGLAVLPGILNLASKKSGPVMKALCNVDAPACALQVAKFMTGSTSRLARRWLMTYPETAIHGLLPSAVGKAGKDRDAAEAALRYLTSQGHRDAIENLAAQAGTELTTCISEVLSVDPRADYMPKKFPAMPSFWDAGIHPRPLLRNGGKALPLSAIETLARMMSISTYDARTPALDAVIDACKPDSLADFAWSVFDEWRTKGDSASNWMFQALAYLGDDRSAKKLTPIIRDWPASNGQAKALLGLDILAAIGTDVALAQIQSIARKNKYKPIVARADEMLTAIAEARELTSEQFEDRLVPTLGLDENGALVLDYGKRRFTGCVDETLKPRLIDETGATLKELPKPGKDDDKALAKQAGEDWAEFKTELKPVASLQLLRLENAMIDARRWSSEEFQRLVAGHPLLQQAVRSLVWGLFNDKGKLLKNYRILPDGTAQDVKGKPVEIEATSLVGIPHPIVLGDEAAAWKKVFADAKQGQAFAQLVRKTYRREDDAEMDLFGLQGATIHSKTLKGLKSLGWEMVLSGFADLIEGYYRSFSSGDVEMRIEPGVFIRDLGNNAEEVTVEINVPKTLTEIEFSELMRELHTLKK